MKWILKLQFIHYFPRKSINEKVYKMKYDISSFTTMIWTLFGVNIVFGGAASVCLFNKVLFSINKVSIPLNQNVLEKVVSCWQ